jgi:hypothetical protein
MRSGSDHPKRITLRALLTKVSGLQATFDANAITRPRLKVESGHRYVYGQY